MTTTRSGVAAAALAAVLATGLLVACGSDPMECKDAPHKVVVQFEAKSKGQLNNPDFEAAKAQAQSKWESEVKDRFGAEWASLKSTRSQGSTCGVPDGQSTGACQVEAAPCRKKK